MTYCACCGKAADGELCRECHASIRDGHDDARAELDRLRLRLLKADPVIAKSRQLLNAPVFARGRCHYCHEEAGHGDDCPWLALVQAFEEFDSAL